MVSPPAAHCGMFPMRVLPLLPSVMKKTGAEENEDKEKH